MTTTLQDIFDVETFRDLIDQGYINVREHWGDTGLRIANYADKTQYDRRWCVETLNSRGLIYLESTGEVISRPFPKFFNFDDSTQPNPPVGPAILSNKFDGSLGIMYLYEDQIWFATRGSFESEQAMEAQKMLLMLGLDEYGLEQVKECKALLKEGFTPLFEILYPENRIVVDYSGQRRLVLLDVIENATGKSALDKFDSLLWEDKAEKTLLSQGFYDTIASDIPQGDEGFVLYWPHSGFRCKVKSAEYIHLHSILTNTSSRDLWRSMAVHACKHVIDKPKMWGSVGVDPMRAKGILAGSEDWVSDVLSGVPDEFYAWVRITMDSIETKVDTFIAEATKVARDLLQVEAGKDRWEASQGYPEPLGAVALHYANTGNDNRLLIAAWKNAYPAFEKPFAEKSEDVA